MFARFRELFFNMTAALIAFVILSSLLIASYEMETWPFGDHRTIRERYEFRRVARTDLEPYLRAPGRVESSKRTVVTCKLENMAGTTNGVAATSGSSTIIWLIEEATEVDEGDLLAKLDSSTYEEMLRQQTIVVEQAKASHLQAQLDVEIAKIALKEYMEGTVQETVEQMEANLSLARSNLTQSGQRLDWTRKMNKKGYASIAQIKTDEQNYLTNELALQSEETTYDLFKRFTLPKNQMTLQADITTAQTTLDSEQVKLNRQLERFALLQRQVDRCSIRAPHDGVVYYYFDTRPRRPDEQSVQIEEGMTVRQEQKLFYLPDLDEMEIQVVLNESIVNRVNVGLTGTVEFEALPGKVLTGKIVSISEIPNQVNQRGEDVRYFMGILKLERTTDGLRPGMSAIVNLTLARSEGILAVPPETIISNEGRYECYLPVGEDRLERREVKIGRTTPELIEITEGLAEGEEITVDPPGRASTRPRSLAGFDSRPWPKAELVKLDGPTQAGPAPGGRGGAGRAGRRQGGNNSADGAPRKSRRQAAPEE
jgi:HlyD family secretion protein